MRKLGIGSGGRLAAVAMALMASTSALSQSPQERMLAGFEGDDALTIDTSNATAAIRPDATNGGSSLAITYGPQVENVVTISPAAAWNLTVLGDANLAFDITNPGSVSTQIFVDLKDASGRTQRRSAVVAAGETATFYAVLSGFEAGVETGLREIPPAWKSGDHKLTWRHGDRSMDMSQIVSVSVATEAQVDERPLRVDNIRLRANPPADPFFLTDLVDRFGQSVKRPSPYAVRNEDQLRMAAHQELAELAASEGPQGRSKYGGWLAGPRQEATGHFTTAKVDGRWWLVDPEGYLFFSSGIANVRMANLGTITGYDFGDPSVRARDPEELTPEDSRGIDPVSAQAVGTRFLASPLRRNMFQWLPGYDEPLGDAYGYRRSVHQGAVEHGEIFSFYKANLQRRYGADYMRTWRQVTLDRMTDWGMTSFGNWIDPIYYDNQQMPYFANGWIIGDFATVSSGNDYWAPLPDPYDPEFKRRARLTIEQIGREVNGSEWCIGVFVDNEKSWGRTDTLSGHYGVVLDALSKSSDTSPAKAAFTRLLREKYGSIAGLNAVWKTGFVTWEAFADGASVSDLEAAQPDLSMLFADFAETYFRTVSSELERVMPDHMYMGVRMAEWGMPEEVTRAAVRYSDVLSYNVYRQQVHPETWNFLNEIDRPTIIGEFHIGSTSDTGLYHPGLVIAADQADRGRMYEIYMNSVLDHPMMVGAHWFQYVDDNVTGRAFDGENYNVGWVTNADIPYPEMREAARRFNYGLYERRVGQ